MRNLRKFSFLIAVFILFNLSRSADAARPIVVPKVNANVALSSLIALSDGHLEKIADSMKLAATTEAVQSLDWERVRFVLENIAKSNIEAGFWFALPDGSYFTLQKGKESETLSDRPYFSKVIAGQTVMGDLVVSKSSRKNVAIVATPIYGKDGKVGGILGASVFLDKLAEHLDSEMRLDRTMIYYSFNSKPELGMVWDPTLIFSDPHQLGKETSKAFDDMLTKKEGVESYIFRGKRRTVVFRKSDVTGWWYAFGIVPAGREVKGAKIAKSR